MVTLEHVAQEAAGERRHEAQPQLASLTKARASHVFSSLTQILGADTRLAQETLTCGRRLGASSGAFEQGHAEPSFEVLHTPANCRLRQVQNFRCSTEAAVLRNRNRVAEKTKIKG